MSAPGQPDYGEPVARRVLVVSADIGGGHDATGRALEERVHALWPGSRVGWVDTLEVMGPGVGRGFRRTYVTNVGMTPWLYEFFWASLWRHRWFAVAAKWFTGAWAGRRLAPVIEAFDPDLIVSTYPLGSAGLAWLRRRRGLGVPVGAWVSDFAPHPFWVYSDLDLNVVVHPAALPVAAVAAAGAPLGVCAPPVLETFHPGDRVEAARRCDLDPERSAVVVACGSYGFGSVEEAIRALVDIGDDVQVVAVCGRNERLAERLAALEVPPGRLLVRGWVDDMPTLLRAARLLVTNAGGATALEALATGTPIVMYRPIAAHGAANAALMAAAGLAETAHTPQTLVSGVRTRLRQPARPVLAPSEAWLPDLGLPAVARSRQPDGGPTGPYGGGGGGRGGPDGQRAGSAASRLRRRGGRGQASWPLRAQDAFFRHVQTPSEAQQIGTVLELGPRPDGGPLTGAELTRLLAGRLPAITTLRRRLVDRGRWRRPGWVVDGFVDAAAHIDEVHVRPGDDGSAVIDAFWSDPLPLNRPPWRMVLVRGLPDGHTRLAVKMHHSLGDGLSVIAVLQRLIDMDEPAGAAREAVPPRGTARPTATRLGNAPERAGLDRTREAARLVGRTIRGLARLAAQGSAPRTPLNRPLASPRRRLVTATLPAPDVLRAARACHAHASELMLALTAGALATAHPAPAPDRLRAMFAVSHDPRRRAPTQGNWTGAVTLDLPLVPMPATARITAVRRALREALASGEAEAAGLVMRAMGALPAPVHAALARRVYTSRRLNVVVSYVPALFQARLVGGAPIRSATPVVALADGVHLGIGVLRRGNGFEIGLILNEALTDVGEAFAVALRGGLDDLLAEVDGTPSPHRTVGAVGVGNGGRPAGGDGGTAVVGPEGSVGYRRVPGAAVPPGVPRCA
ncbi:wax ester/triacylglycerol synthase domain-containing protein [Micromonospora krabiensis]|uniref:Acyltransferase, WS/DGAT/MGAT n=1 Tax=Micromonospora krabiensis TaxID=307121 RepID=A0A1C3N0B5_9ACTN|nr:wax ester/triacylglycerol synthase domain-containing protein [Micromonospora krabiensis]SBV26001.1 acyltransferase, WS/DGAT/MGAT [Micromonospora krabiensis]